MTFNDRTQEFNAVAEAVRARQANPKQFKNQKQQQRSQFILTASQIGKSIFETSEKLNKLSKLAKKGGLFDNPTVEIEELTFIIKQDIQNLNKQISLLKEFSSKGSSNKQGETHSKTVINYLNFKLADTTKGFKDILQVRTETLKEQANKRNIFAGKSSLAPATPPPARFAGADSTVEPSLDSENAPTIAFSSTPIPTPNPAISPLNPYATSPSHVLRHRRATRPSYDAENAAHLPESPSTGGGEVAIAMPVLLQQEHTSSRAVAVESIEKTLSELQTIFGDLVHLVAEQGDMIQRLDANIDNVALDVDRGHSALLKNLYSIFLKSIFTSCNSFTNQDISSNRGLIIKLFVVLIVFMVLFVVFVV